MINSAFCFFLVFYFFNNFKVRFNLSAIPIDPTATYLSIFAMQSVSVSVSVTDYSYIISIYFTIKAQCVLLTFDFLPGFYYSIKL